MRHYRVTVRLYRWLARLAVACVVVVVGILIMFPEYPTGMIATKIYLIEAAKGLKDVQEQK